MLFCFSKSSKNSSPIECPIEWICSEGARERGSEGARERGSEGGREGGEGGSE